MWAELVFAWEVAMGAKVDWTFVVLQLPLELQFREFWLGSLFS